MVTTLAIFTPSPNSHSWTYFGPVSSTTTLLNLLLSKLPMVSLLPLSVKKTLFFFFFFFYQTLSLFRRLPQLSSYCLIGSLSGCSFTRHALPSPSFQHLYFSFGESFIGMKFWWEVMVAYYGSWRHRPSLSPEQQVVLYIGPSHSDSFSWVFKAWLNQDVGMVRYHIHLLTAAIDDPPYPLPILLALCSLHFMLSSLPELDLFMSIFQIWFSMFFSFLLSLNILWSI